MYKLEFTLKQHTPLIHFQHTQDGATLRASEVKPKLDRLIIEKFGGVEIVREVHPEWLIGKGDHPALDYKLSLKGTRVDEFILTAYIPRRPREVARIKPQTLYQEDLREQRIKFIDEIGYFADSDKISKKQFEDIKKGIMYNPVNGSISCLCSDLIFEIEKVLVGFYVINSFGCRTTKGFGSFSISTINSSGITVTDNDILSSFKLDKDIIAVYSCDFDVNSTYEVILKSIKTDAQILRSGLNNPGKNYVKSLLFLYFCYKFNSKWDKRWIKKQMGDYYNEVPKENEPIDCDCSNNSDFDDVKYLFERAVLGLPENNEYRLTGANRKFIIDIDNDDIERFKSPLTFKLINKTVYLIVYDSFKSILDNYFSFKLYKKDGDTKTWLKNFDDLITPDGTFNLIGFLDWAFKYIRDIEDDTIIRDEACQDDLIEYYFNYDKIYEKHE